MNGSADIDGHAVESLDCADFVLLVDDLTAADPTEWGQIAIHHLDECPPCLVYLQQMQDLRTLLQHAALGHELDDAEVARVLTVITAMGEEYSDDG